MTAPPEAVAHDAVALWAAAQATALAAGDAPDYGSRAWSALPAADARRAVAILAAAEQWRRHTCREQWLDRLADEDPERWFAYVTGEANAYARTIARDLTRRPTLAELAVRRRTSTARARPVRAAPGWPPVAVPGRPGWVRTLTPDGHQSDRPATIPRSPRVTSHHPAIPAPGGPPQLDPAVRMLTAPPPYDAPGATPWPEASAPVAVPVPERHRGHLRMAERFVVEHADHLRHVHGIGWHEWDGARWAADEERADIAAAVATVKTALGELDRLDGRDRAALFKDVRRSESATGLDGMVRIASALPPVSTPSRALDADPYLFNTPAGTVNLRTGSVRANDRADLLTKTAGGPLAADGGTEWRAFLARVLPDETVRAFVQRLFGYAMLGKVTEHVMPIFTGTGANGKGTLRDALMAAFGDYAIEVDPAILMESKHERHGAFKMRLRGARLAFCSETDKGRRFAEATMKRLVGGDPIEANLMHRNPITFDPSHTLIMLTNFLPAVSGDDPAIWRRILIVPFDVTIPEAERDPGLPERLKSAAPAVLAWAYQGWRDYQAQGLNPPEAVRVRTAAYQAASDVLARFLDERAITNPHGAVKARDLFTAWSRWCAENGEQPGNEATFAESMRKRGHDKTRRSAGQFYPGLMLAGTDDDAP